MAPAPDAGPLVTVFTAAHGTGRGLELPYASLSRQSYHRWEWVVVDNSPDDETYRCATDIAERDRRVRPHRPEQRTDSIGAAKATAGQLAHGEILVELDHDDELLDEALSDVVAVFTRNPDIDFVCSDWVDVLDGHEPKARYGTGFGFGLGAYATELVDGRRVPVAMNPPLTREAVGHIVGMPNHLRAWRKSSYDRVGGHDPSLRVADDYDLMVRTFLDGLMARIPRPLYVQHYRSDRSNASATRNAEIQRLVARTADQNRERLDRRCLSLGVLPADGDEPTLLDDAPIARADIVIDPRAQEAEARGTPLISVVIPTWGRPFHLARAIETALAQTYPNIEVLVVGDHCPDVDRVIAVFDDVRVRHWNLEAHHGDYGRSPRNYALKAMARGTLIAYLDDDNWWEPHHLELLWDLMKSDPGSSFAFSSFEADGQIIWCRRPRKFQIDTSALLHRRFLLERYGYWGLEYSHDWELVSRWDNERWLASLCATVHYSVDPSRQGDAIAFVRQVSDEETRAAANT